jgi:hypothetical protein
MHAKNMTQPLEEPPVQKIIVIYFVLNTIISRLNFIAESKFMKPVRRVVIAQDKENQSDIIEDSNAKDIDYFITGVKEAVSINLWATSKMPPTLEDVSDSTQSELPFLPSKNGTLLRICDIPPDSLYINRLDEILLNNQKISAEQKVLKHPLMHKVDCLIYAVVLDGEVTLILDKTQTILKAGDIIIDYGSHHAWSNHTNHVCRMLFVLLDAISP